MFFCREIITFLWSVRPQLFSVLRSSAHFASMCQTLGKREREPEFLQDSIGVGHRKRFHGKETDGFLSQLDKTLTEGEEEEECAPNEEAVNGLMRILEEEIGTPSSTSYLPSNSEENSAASYTFSSHESQTLGSDMGIDLSYLLEASDDDLGIPPSPVLELNDEIFPSPNQTTEGLSENAYLKSLGEAWLFDDKFDNFPQLTLYEDSWDASQLEDYMNIDFVSQSMLFDWDASVLCRLETAGGL